MIYLTGLIWNNQPERLMCPVYHNSTDALFTWLSTFFNTQDFKLSMPLTKGLVVESLKEDQPILIAIGGYPISMMFGKKEIIEGEIDELVEIEGLDLLDKDGIQELLNQKLQKEKDREVIYTVGLIKNDLPDALISPASRSTIQGLYEWLTEFFNKDDFRMSQPITVEQITEALKKNSPVLVKIEGYPISIMFGEKSIIMNATSRFVNIIGLDLLDRKSISNLVATIQKYVKPD